MTREELMNLSEKDLKARMKAIRQESQTAAGEALDRLVEEADIIDGMMKDIANRKKLAGMAEDEEELGEDAGEEKKGENADAKNKAREERGKTLKAGKAVKYNSKAALMARNALSSSQTVMPQHTATDIKPTFNDVSSLVDRVRIVPLNGGESYKRGYVKSYGDGANYTAEKADYNETEPEFGYAEIKKEKITAYTEEPEEMVKLPAADYDSVVEDSVVRTIRKFCSRQILIGDGASGHFKGIFFKPNSEDDDIIERETDLSLTAIDDATLDEIIYSFGGDEEVEDLAVLILNKKDLKAFAKLRDKQGRKVYTIVNRGNTGSIDGVPFIINSACKAITDAQTATDDYCMAYGPLSNYEMAIFSDIDARKSTDYKFKSGQIAYRADIYAGGNVAAHNGFLRVYRPKTAS